MLHRGLSHAEAVLRSRTVHVRRYEVELDLCGASDTFASTSQIWFDATAGTSTFLDLAAARVHQVTLNGQPVDLSCAVSGERITLSCLREENVVLVNADCWYSRTGEGMHRFVDPQDGETYLYTHFEPANARRVFAAFDQPDMKAAFTFTVVAPAHWLVASNTAVDERQENRSPGSELPIATTRFAPTAPLASYATAVVAGPYVGESGQVRHADGRVTALRVLGRRSLAEHLDAREVLELAGTAIKHFEQLFDIPYPFDGLDQVFVPEFNAGAMENAGCVTLSEQLVFRGHVTQSVRDRRAVTILHEVAHMWFGNLVTPQWWDGLWLNESFAEYFSVLAAAQTGICPDAWADFCIQRKAWAYRQDQMLTTHPLVTQVHDLDDVDVTFDGITYAKGAAALRQLAFVLGWEVFMSSLSSFLRRRAWANADLGDLLDALCEHSGRDLAQWSAGWLETSGVDHLRPGITTDTAGLITSFDVSRTSTAPGRARTHAVSVGIYAVLVQADGQSRLALTSRSTLEIGDEVAHVPSLVGKPHPGMVLLNDGDMTYAKVRLDDRSLLTAVEHLQALDDPLARALVWSTSWDMTRDAEWPAGRFIQLVLRNVAVEPNSSLTSTLLRNLEVATRLCTAPGRRASAAASVAGGLWQLAESAPPGSDTQLQMVKAWARYLCSPEECAAAWRLLGRRPSLPNLRMSQDLRWELLLGLAAAGDASANDVMLEQRRDPSAAGERAACSALAAVPTHEAKAAAWGEIVDNSLGVARHRALTAGFVRVNDTKLLEPFAAKYFASVGPLWHARKSSESRRGFVTGLFPTMLAGSHIDVAASARAWLGEHPDAPFSLRRLIEEELDGVSRILRAQECDSGHPEAVAPTS